MIFFIGLTTSIYFIGLLNCIFIKEKNILSFLISSEIMFLGLDLFFIGTSILFSNFSGLIFGFLILMLTIGESAIGLGLCIIALKLEKNINFIHYSNLKF